MPSSRLQNTLASPVAIIGQGYWSGDEVTVEFRPAPAGSGVVFVRDDLPAPVRIPATVAYQDPAARRTNLTIDGVRVEMVEHILAALMGLGVDNCEVGVTGEEMPGCDGSSLAFVEAILQAGIAQQAAEMTPLVVTRPIRCGEGENWIEARPPIGEGLSIEYNLDYGGDSPIEPQWFVAEITPPAFQVELAPARTFVLQEEAEAIQAQGLARHVTPQELLIFGPEGPLENQLRYPDECARHKALDVVGDLALAGVAVVGHVVACRSGHRLNAELVRALLASHSDQTGRADNARKRSA